jgi:SAM-dependent methyltransferase
MVKIKNCILCFSDLLKFSHKIIFSYKNYYYDICLNCNFVFQNPWPSIKIEKIYNSYQYWNYGGEASYKSYQLSRSEEATKRYKKITKYFNTNGSVLEIGCANGIFLTDFKKNGWTCMGIDPSKEMIEFGIQNYGLNLKCKKIEDLNNTTNLFDLIYMWGVDGNFYDFKKAYKKIRASLKKGGIYSFSYQDFKHPINRIFKSHKKHHHILYHFSKKSIYYLMNNLGFEILEHKLTFQKTKLSHIANVLRLGSALKSLRSVLKLKDFSITIPAISYNFVIAKKT